ncbi:MAG: excinuclease ABC subunit UvrC, partial [Candidatus Thalassarchaeaceae archaeon]|nr:excinuclease ABC subunit UvrC [Candidatus Thalassarchaeaceae archaeon]
MSVDASKLHLPSKPGVYLFKRDDGRVLYVGKATVLKERVKSYFSTNPDRNMIPKMVEEADNVDCIVTPNPREALTLERELIRSHKPKYNSLMTDDKSYPFIAITDEEVPRIIYTRHPPENARLWGPFPDAGAAKQVIQLLRRQFGVRDCPTLLPQGCLAMHIGLCSAPCIDATGYDQQVEAVTQVMEGNAELLLTTLQEDMDLASEKMQFEEAARSRDIIASVQRTLSQKVVSSRFYQDVDAIGFGSRGDLGAVVFLHAKQGVVTGKTHYPLLHRGDVSESVSLILSEHYHSRRPPAKILTPTPIGQQLEDWLKERRNGAVEIRVPIRGELATLRALADQNAEMQAQRAFDKRSSGNLEKKSATECATYLEVESLDTVVCFDMAQLQGNEKVGACITLRNGRPDKKGYRTYKVKQDVFDDLRMMREVVERWLKRQDEWPDLLLLDGGETHLSTISGLLEEHGLQDRIPLAALAKREETLYRSNKEPLILDRRGRILVFARDEAHRFVNNFHRKRRAKSTLRDPLEAVEGLGAKKLQALLRHFGGRKGIDEASLKALQKVPGIGKALA